MSSAHVEHTTDSHSTKSDNATAISHPAGPSPAADAPHDKSDKAAQLELISNANARLQNPLAGKSHESIRSDAEAFARNAGLDEEDVRAFGLGGIVAQDPTRFEKVKGLNEEELVALRREVTHKWHQPWPMYFLVIACSMAAAVQGMDEAVISGANLFFAPQFGIGKEGDASRNEWLLGLVNSAPYLCCAVIGCWLTDPLNYYLGRRGTIFLTAAISALTCFWQGVTNSWEHLFVARFMLGFGIGPKSATVPVFASESAPTPIRGALVMMWQMWTAAGIAIGYAADLAFYKVPDKPGIRGLNWRLMLGSAGFPALIVMAQVFFCPESPRWLLGKNRPRDAYKSLLALRGHRVLAARDLYYMHVLLQEENQFKKGRNRFIEMFTIGRNRRGALGAFIVMFMQQFCGINVIVYYSSTIFVESGTTEIVALLGSFGFGMVNWLFALPAVYTIDIFGRRNLLLTTFPLMSLFLLMTGFCFWIDSGVTESSGRLAGVATGIYIYCAIYSVGEGPVPFTYSAEAFPLYIRDLGMSFATAVCWFFNFVVAITFPRLLGAFKPQGAFGWYAGWNAIGFFLVLFFLPETKGLSLEELDQVFSVPTHTHAAWGLRQLPYFFKKYVFRQNVEPEYLYHHEQSSLVTSSVDEVRGKGDVEKQ